jgi:hypothetical protein
MSGLSLTASALILKFAGINHGFSVSTEQSHKNQRSLAMYEHEW